MGGSPDDAVAVATAVEVLLERTGARLVDGPVALSGGLDTYVYALQSEAPAGSAWAGRLVLRIYPSTSRAESARREARAQSWCVRQGYPAAEPVDVGDEVPGIGLPYLLMRHAPGRTMLAALGARPWQAGAMLRLLVDRRWDALRLRVERLHPSYAGRVDTLVRHRGCVAQEVVCLGHNDFHPLNVLVDGDSATVVDWANVDVGDPHHDVARTLVAFQRRASRGDRCWTAARVATHATTAGLDLPARLRA